MVFITTDPARDTPAVLREYLDRYDSDFVGLTGDLDDITTAARRHGRADRGHEEAARRAATRSATARR